MRNLGSLVRGEYWILQSRYDQLDMIRSALETIIPTWSSSGGPRESDSTNTNCGLVISYSTR